MHVCHVECLTLFTKTLLLAIDAYACVPCGMPDPWYKDCRNTLVPLLVFLFKNLHYFHLLLHDAYATLKTKMFYISHRCIGQSIANYHLDSISLVSSGFDQNDPIPFRL